jgi:three-Cys-motif partner protein
MTAFWGNDSWRRIAYDSSGDMFGFPHKQPNKVIAEAFRERLKRIAGFQYVPEPMPMKNSNNAIIYYLFFASQKPVAANIVEDIFKKYADRGD